MQNPSQVLEYKCPCCNAGLHFGSDTQQLTCEYCSNTFDIQTVRAFNESAAMQEAEELVWDPEAPQQWQAEEQYAMRSFQCPACGGAIMTDANTAATFCPFCDNPTILPSRLHGGLRPDGVVPFKTTKDDAKKAFLELCKGKPLLPAEFTSKHRLEKITGMYVPFWLYDCKAEFSGSYKATRIHRWSDSQYDYTRTEHFLLRRDADASFVGIPMDGSTKINDAYMESIEPFDYSQIVPFDMAYLSGYLADKYDVESSQGEERIRQRVDSSINSELQATLIGYTTAIPTTRQLHVHHSKARYILLPVWMLNTRYNGKLYTYVMNGQSGKMTGSFPICPKRTALWFTAVCAGVTALATVVQLFL